MLETVSVFSVLAQESDDSISGSFTRAEESDTRGGGPSALLRAGIMVGIIRTRRCSFRKKKKNTMAIA